MQPDHAVSSAVTATKLPLCCFKKENTELQLNVGEKSVVYISSGMKSWKAIVYILVLELFIIYFTFALETILWFSS